MKLTTEYWVYTGFNDHCDIDKKYYSCYDDYGFETINQNGILDSQHASLIAATSELLSICKFVLSKLNKTTTKDNKLCCDKLSAIIAKIEK